MNTRERFVATLTGQPADRVPFIKIFGGTNAHRGEWEKDCPGIGRTIDQVLQFEGGYRGWQITPVNVTLSGVGPIQVLEEDDEKIVRRLGDGTVQVIQKAQDFGAHTIEWPVKNRKDWDRIKRAHLQADDPTRFPSDWPALAEGYRNRDFALQLTHAGVYGFARTMMGDQNLAYAFYDDPDLVHDLMDTYTGLAIAIWTQMAADTSFDLIECWEDMASRNGALISPAMFREFCAPNFQRVSQFAQAHGVPIVLVDSDGYIEDLTPLMLDAGVTALYPYEVQAGNDIDRVMDRHPAVGVLAGLDKRVMAQGRAAIDREMEKARHLIRRGRFIPGPDHFVLSDVTWDNYRYFMEQLRQVVLTTPPGKG